MFSIVRHCVHLDDRDDRRIIARSLLTARFVVVHIDALQLKIVVSHVVAGRVDTMLVRDYFPELRIEKLKKCINKSEKKKNCAK